MSFIFDPIESGINSLLEPLTSIPTDTSPTTSVDEVIPVETSIGDDSESTTTSRTPTSAVVVTPTSTKAASTASSTRSAVTSDPEAATTRSARTSSTSDDSTSLSFPTLTGTTLSTSKTAASSSSSRPPPVPPASAEPTFSPAQATANENSNTSSGSGLSTAGIAIAAIFSAALVISIIWLTIRFCPPVRKRIDAWYEKRREERTWREALDGPAAEKGSMSSITPTSSEQSRPFSFFALGRNPQLHPETINNTSREPIHQQYTSPNSADTPTRGHGLGLGRVSLLRNTSLLRKAGFEAPPSLPQHPPQSASPTSQSATSLKMSMSQIKRKPLPAHPPVMYHEEIQPNRQPTFPYVPVEHMRTRSRDTNSPLPVLHLQIPGSAPGSAGVGEESGRVSQIGLAVSGSPAVQPRR